MANDGAPPGEYTVTAIWPKIPPGAPADETEGPDQLEGRCSNAKISPWHFHVEMQPNNLGTLDIESWPKPAKTLAPPKGRPKVLD